MSFRKNDCQQLSFVDSFWGLTEREKKVLQNSWAGIFADEIFPCIDEARFACLYSDVASRPNTPVNVILGALIIKELFDYTDDELVENLMLDLHLQYALHTTSCKEQPLSDKTLSRFRKRCYEYEQEHGVDLYKDFVEELSGKVAKMMKINGKIRRMDSMMIESNIRYLTRVELIYTCMANLCIRLSKDSSIKLDESLVKYIEPNNFNRMFYYDKETDPEEKAKCLLHDCDVLLGLCGQDFEDMKDYELFVRCLEEQTVVEDGCRRFRTKAERSMSSNMLQNPSDPEATYRSKAGKPHRGYVANIEESVGVNGSIVTSYDYKQNTYSDSQFLKDRLEEIETSDEKICITADGAYSGEENSKLAKEKNIELITTTLSGKETPDVFADFTYNEDGTKLESCAAGFAPEKCSYRKSTGQITATFSGTTCLNCPHRRDCNPKFKPHKAIVTTSLKAKKRAEYVRNMNTENFKLFAKLRNGVETIPSILRKNFRLDKLPRGIIRGKFFFGSKVNALNFRKLFGFRKGLGKCAPNALLA